MELRLIRPANRAGALAWLSLVIAIKNDLPIDTFVIIKFDSQILVYTPLPYFMSFFKVNCWKNLEIIWLICDSNLRDFHVTKGKPHHIWNPPNLS